MVAVLLRAAAPRVGRRPGELERVYVEMFDGFAVLEVSLYHLGHILLYDADVPGTPRVDDQVRAVFTETEAAYGVHANVPVHALRTQLVLERLAHGLGPALFAVAALADEHVGVVVPDLRGRL